MDHRCDHFVIGSWSAFVSETIITQCGNISINAVQKVQVIYFSTTHTRNMENKSREREEVKWHEKQLISSLSLTQGLSVSLVKVESDTGRQAGRQAGGFGPVGGGEGRRGSLLSSDLSGLELGNKVFDCLFLEVGAHIAGEGPVRVALFCSTESTQ